MGHVFKNIGHAWTLFPVETPSKKKDVFVNK